MSPLMDGVRLGPLDPDRGENFGQVGGQTTARQLIRHHVAMHPPALVAALSRVRQDDRSKAIDRDEAEAFIREVYDDAGQALPDESQITGYAVRGDDEAPDLQVVTFTYTTKGGRTGKGFVPYRELSNSVAAGDEAVRIAELKEAGLPWGPSETARQVAGIRGTQVGPADDAGDADALRGENEDLRSENEELRERLRAIEEQEKTDEQVRAEQEHAASAGGGSGVQSSPQTPEGGSPETTGTRTAADADDGDSEPVEPWDGYDTDNADKVKRRLREERDPELAEKVLAWEQRPDAGQNRSGVVAVANSILDRPQS